MSPSKIISNTLETLKTTSDNITLGGNGKNYFINNDCGNIAIENIQNAVICILNNSGNILIKNNQNMGICIVNGCGNITIENNQDTKICINNTCGNITSDSNKNCNFQCNFKKFD